jgi:Tol biopolymer transport system component
VFTATGGGRHGVYLLAVSDCRIETVDVREDLWLDFPDWSPDGRQLAFATRQNGIVVMRPDGSQVGT